MENWSQSEFTSRARVKPEKLDIIKKIKGRLSIARKLDEIIDFYLKQNGYAT